MTILGVDVGTTGLKMAVFSVDNGTLTSMGSYSDTYEIRTYNNGLFSDIHPEKWQKAFAAGCQEMQDLLGDVEVIGLSGTTPGMTSMDGEGNVLYPAILMLDQRSRNQAQRIIDTIGMQSLLDITGNMPVAGGCSLASILWIKDNHPDIFDKIHTFGHSNTFMSKWLTGNFAIDPSSASLTALYNTVANDLTWNKDIGDALGLSVEKLPKLIPSYESAGRVTNTLAKQLGLVRLPRVVIGGNDAVLAAYSVGIVEPGDATNVNGTCEITLVCLPKCLGSKNYNVRAHALPGRWLTLYVMNAGGNALEWFRNLFCREMEIDAFYNEFITEAIETFLERERSITYVPYLMGSRYSLEPLKAEFLGLTAETTREELMAAMIRGLCHYQREHLKEISIEVPLNKMIHVTGGAVNPAIIQAKKKWMRNCDYVHEEESSMKGAALLGLKYLEQNR